MPADILSANASSEQFMADRKILFLDRDGTINTDGHYVYRTEDFQWIPGIRELCRAALKAGYEIVVITNQSGIARGYYTEEDYRQFTAFMEKKCAEEGISLLAVYHCPNLEGEDRKPRPGLFLKARDRWGIDMSASVSLGDKERDVEAAASAGVGRNFLLSRHLCATRAYAVVADPREMIPYLSPPHSES